MMQRLLEFYFAHTPKPLPFAIKLYRKRFNLDWRPDGDPIPRLRLSLAQGRLYNAVTPENYIDLASMPGKEAMLLNYLMRNPERSIRRDVIADRIWPESSRAENPNNNLNQTVHKLRARLTGIFGKEWAKEYIQTSQSGLSLCHVDVDINQLLNQARKALTDLQKERFWMAEMHFREMKRLADPFPADFHWLPEEVNLLTSACEAWIELCKRASAHDMALAVAELGRKIDPLHERLYELHYELLLGLDLLSKAAHVRQNYETMLEELER